MHRCILDECRHVVKQRQIALAVTKQTACQVFSVITIIQIRKLFVRKHSKRLHLSVHYVMQQVAVFLHTSQSGSWLTFPYNNSAFCLQLLALTHQGVALRQQVNICPLLKTHTHEHTCTQSIKIIQVI